MFGHPQLGQQLGQGLGGLATLLPFQVDPLTAAYAGGQLAPQGFSLGGLLRQVPRWIPPAIQAGRQLGLFGVDPLTAAYAGGQLAPQGAIGSFLGQLGQPLGGAIGGMFGHPQLGQQLGQGLGGLATLLPFQVDPLTAAYAGGQQAPFGVDPLTAAYAGGQLAPFGVDPLTAAYAAGQLAPQGFLGGLLGRVGGGIAGRAIGGLFGNPQLGQRIGGIAGGVGGGILPFQAMPAMAPVY
jgi:hypothetical protein